MIRRLVETESQLQLSPPTSLKERPEVQVFPLELLGPGEQGRVWDVEAEESVVHRLHEMGLREGVCVRMVQPGSPCIIAVDNHRFSYRGDDGTVVLIEKQ